MGHWLFIIPVMLHPLIGENKPEPLKPAYFARVDCIVVNRVRSYSTSYDIWGRPHVKPGETWWISFWDHGIWEDFESDRGWWVMGQCIRLQQTNGGWIAESKDGLNVIAPNLRFIDSTFDWEMKNRRNYQPVRKP